MYFEIAQQCSFAIQQVFICYSFVAFLKDYIVLTPCLQVSRFFYNLKERPLNVFL